MPADDVHPLHCHLDELVDARGIMLTDLADAVGITVVNLSILKKRSCPSDPVLDSDGDLRRARLPAR